VEVKVDTSLRPEIPRSRGRSKGGKSTVKICRQVSSSPEPPVLPVVMNVAGNPSNIFARSKANGCGEKAVPDELNAFMLM
jgi:hypothetical protein